MTKVALRVRHRNGRASPLPLLGYIDQNRVHVLPLPARHLVRRYGLSASTALTVSLAIGYACGDDR